MKTQLGRAALMILSLVFFTACGKTGEELNDQISCELSGDNFGIINGKILGSGNELSSSTVLILMEDLDTKDSASSCTGTIISENTILTAAHCVPERAGRGAISFTNNVSCATQSVKVSRPVTSHSVHPKYKYGQAVYGATNDIALIRFSGGLPAGYKKRDLPSYDYRLKKEARLVLAGYGQANYNDETSSGVLRYKYSSAKQIVTSVHYTLEDLQINLPNTILIKQYEGGVCSGDSGGPLYVQEPYGKLTLLGITSAGLDDRTRNAKMANPCAGTAAFADVRTHLKWISSQMRGY